MSHEITVASAHAGITLHIKINGEYGHADLTQGFKLLAFVAFDASQQPQLDQSQLDRPSIQLGRAFFDISANDAPRLRAWLHEVYA